MTTQKTELAGWQHEEDVQETTPSGRPAPEPKVTYVGPAGIYHNDHLRDADERDGY